MSCSSGITLGADGYFRLGDARFVPAGVNYWPGSCGVEMWARWPEEEICHDLDVVAGLGLNTVRFFLRWQDFEPEPGRYDEPMFDRLAQLLGWFAERGLFAQPSLFVGWMSGGVFWPRWREGHNVFADPLMAERAFAFARRAAEVIAPFHACVAGVDQGNELCCLADSREAPPMAVRAWCAGVSRAVHEAYPQALVVSGNEQNQVLNDTGWRFGEQPGTDFLSMHGYPVPNWHSVPFDGMTDPLCQSLLPFYTQAARAWGPVMLQEFGTIVTFGARQQQAYLRALLPACWEAGANGFLWWCLRDIRARVHPYVKNGFEGTLGLVDDNDRVKPGLETFLQFARSLSERPAPLQRVDAVGIYWPKHYYPRDNPLNPGNEPRALSRRLVMANYLLRSLGRTTRVVRGDLPFDPVMPSLVVPGALLDVEEAAALEKWLRGGGRLVWHGPDPVNWGPDYTRLLGARPVDYRAARPAEVSAFGDAWRFSAYPRGMRVELEPITAEVLARDGDGLPVLLANQVGTGTVVYTTPFVEDEPAALAGDRAVRDRWAAWYRGILTAP